MEAGFAARLAGAVGLWPPSCAVGDSALRRPMGRRRGEAFPALGMTMLPSFVFVIAPGVTPGGRVHGAARSWIDAAVPVCTRLGGVCFAFVFNVFLVWRLPDGRAESVCTWGGWWRRPLIHYVLGVHLCRTCTPRRTAVAGRCGRCSYEERTGFSCWTHRPHWLSSTVHDIVRHARQRLQRRHRRRTQCAQACRVASPPSAPRCGGSGRARSGGGHDQRPASPARAQTQPPCASGLRRAPPPLFFCATRGPRPQRLVSVSLRSRAPRPCRRRHARPAPPSVRPSVRHPTPDG